MLKKLLAARSSDKEIVHFDDDGRIYELNFITNSYVATEKYVYLDYYGKQFYMLPPEYLRTGLYTPVENDVTYEIFDSEEFSDVAGELQVKNHSTSE